MALILAAQPLGIVACQETPGGLPAPTRAAIQALLGKEATPEGDRVTPRYQIPFQADLHKPLIAVRDVVRAKRLPGELPATFFFDESGRFMGAESEAQVTDPARVTPEQSERLMRGIGHAIVGVAALPPGFELSTIWDTVAERVALDQIREFSLYPVLYADEAGRERPAVIVKIWGPRNPLGMREEFSEVRKNRIRFIYYLDDGTWEADNFL